MKKEIMLGRILPILVSVPTEMLGTLLDLLNRLAGEKGEEIFRNIKHLLRGEFEIKVPLIRWLGITTTPATTEKFVAKDMFCKKSKDVTFYEIWDNFREWFLSDEGKIEDPINELTLRYGEFPRRLDCFQIMEEIGGEEKAEITLTEFYDLLKKQPNGKKGLLLTNGCPNFFYIRDISGVIRSVGVDWHGGGWRVGAFDLRSHLFWSEGERVFFRNS